MIWVREDLRALFDGLAFEDFCRLGQREAKRSRARTTSFFARGGRGFYVKVHGGLGWLELARSLLQGKRPIIDATTEVRALERCAAHAIPAPRVVAYGRSGASPATRRSFIVTEALEDCERMSELCAHTARPAAALRHALARALGELVGRLHAAGLGHQDLYLTHIFARLHEPAAPQLFLLDLHRALPRPSTSVRWRVKDLAALRSSTYLLPLTRTDRLRFARAYRARAGHADGPVFWARVERRARARAR